MTTPPNKRRILPREENRRPEYPRTVENQSANLSEYSTFDKIADDLSVALENAEPTIALSFKEAASLISKNDFNSALDLIHKLMNTSTPGTELWRIVIRMKIYISLHSDENKVTDRPSLVYTRVYDAYNTDIDTIHRNIAKKEEELVEEPHTADEKFKLWNAALEAEGVPKAERPAYIVAFKHIIGYRIVGRPRWTDSDKPEDLKLLTAPAFLRRVHKDDIINDHIYKETIRAYDPDLMKSVESYISKREGRKADLGDAAGLILVVSKPATHSRAGRNDPERPTQMRASRQRPLAT